MVGWLVGLALVCAFVCALVSAVVCSFLGLSACVLSWVEILGRGTVGAGWALRTSITLDLHLHRIHLVSGERTSALSLCLEPAASSRYTPSTPTGARSHPPDIPHQHRHDQAPTRPRRPYATTKKERAVRHALCASILSIFQLRPCCKVRMGPAAIGTALHHWL